MKKIILLRDVHGDFPFDNTVAPAGVYEPSVNPHGAVSVEATNGELLGIKPDEYEWLNKE